MIQKIRFANLDFDYDQKILKEEILSISSSNMQNLSAKSIVLSDQWRIPLFSDEQINDTTIIDDNGNLIRKKNPGWIGIGLTMLPENTKSKGGAVRIRNSNTNESWVWREDIQTPYIRELVELLGFKTLHTIRIMMLPAGSIGLVHNDDVDRNYYKNGRLSVTFNVDDGGSPLVFLEKDKRYDMFPNKTFIFRDDCWHGIPQVSRQRIQVRMSGIIDEENLESLLDFNNIVMTN